MCAARTVYQITWHLTGNRKIVKRDEGSQQAFTKMSRAERNAITLDCLRVTYLFVEQFDEENHGQYGRIESI